MEKYQYYKMLHTYCIFLIFMLDYLMVTVSIRILGKVFFYE